MLMLPFLQPSLHNTSSTVKKSTSTGSYGNGSSSEYVNLRSAATDFTLEATSIDLHDHSFSNAVSPFYCSW